MTLQDAAGSDAEARLREDLEQVAPGGWDRPDPPVPALSTAGLAAALVDARGTVLEATAAFRALPAGFAPDIEHLGQVRRGAAPITAIEPDGATGSIVTLYASPADAAQWPIGAELAFLARPRPGAVLVLAVDVRGATGALEEACHAHGLTGLQTRVVLAVIRQGGVRAAAATLGVSFHTAREALAGALARTQTPRLPALVLRLSSLAFGALPEAPGDVMTDIWGLSPRQAAITGLVASGATRSEAARALGVSPALVKKDLDQAYQVLQVDSAANLARKVSEAAALQALTRATAGELGPLSLGGEPLRFVARPDGGRIAFSDYGPVGARPVLVAHSGLMTRSVARRLVRALHGAGYRPIAIDRPGFGLTDMTAGLSDTDVYAGATDDTLRVLDHLRLGDCDLVARGAVRYVLALHARAPARLGRVVLVNPGLHAGADGQRGGLFGILKEAYARNPAVVSDWVTKLSRRITYARHGALVRRWMRGSAPDVAAMDDPEIAHDIFLSQRMFATGRIAGYVAEQRDYLEAGPLTPHAGASNWRILIGAHDTIYTPSSVLDHWRPLLPGAQFRLVEEAGRLLAITHPELVVAELRGA